MLQDRLLLSSNGRLKR